VKRILQQRRRRAGETIAIDTDPTRLEQVLGATAEPGSVALLETSRAVTTKTPPRCHHHTAKPQLNAPTTAPPPVSPLQKPVTLRCRFAPHRPGTAENAERKQRADIPAAWAHAACGTPPPPELLGLRPWKWCRNHYARHLLSSAQPCVATLLRTVFEQSDIDAVHAQMTHVLNAVEVKFPKGADHRRMDRSPPLHGP
jgi:hypothetical protein